MYIADLHIHSRFSRATSKDCDAPHLHLWARYKGIDLVGTGDFTHAQWRQELKECLLPAEPGFYRLKEEYALPAEIGGEVRSPRFVLTGEISSIYKKNGRTRKVHNVIMLPDFAAADALACKLEAIGNIHSDGRPILGLDSRDLLEITLETCPEAIFVPAHIWTPHFSLFGAFSGFDTIEECFEDLTPYIHGLETGLSSDPPMNWRISALDRFTLLSNSDAHSPSKLGREANLFRTDFSYPAMSQAIATGQGFDGTLEFFPEEGKYHWDGHRNCQQPLSPRETIALEGKCPRCGKNVTIGVEHRVEELADRPPGYVPEGAKAFEHLVPLPEILAATLGVSAASKKVSKAYFSLLADLGSEFFILRQAALDDIGKSANPVIAEGICRLRKGAVKRNPGYDGAYGTISLFSSGEVETLQGEQSLFGVEEVPVIEEPLDKTLPSVKKETASKEQIAEKPTATGLNAEQWAAVTAEERAVAVVAGPGTGKTKTLVERIAYLVEENQVSTKQITAVTFTNQAAAEMRSRLAQRLEGGAAIAGLTIGTFHRICLDMLPKKPLLDRSGSHEILKQMAIEYDDKTSPKRLAEKISQVKNGKSLEETGLMPEVFAAYQCHLEALGCRDLDDILLEALAEPTEGHRNFRYLLVDEFQDINTVQHRLVRHWSREGDLFVIGDPDQSIYGFRGADAQCFTRLVADFPDCREVRLTKNYRSTPEVLNAAVKIINENPGEPRQMAAMLRSGLAVRCGKAVSPFSEGIWLAKEISHLAGGIDMVTADVLGGNNGVVRSFDDIAVLCRTRRQLALVEDCLAHDGIPCVILGREDFLDSEAVKGCLGFFRSLIHPQDAPSLHAALTHIWQVPLDLQERVRSVYCSQKDISIVFLRQHLGNDSLLQPWLDAVETYLPQVGETEPRVLLETWAERYDSGAELEKLRHMAVFHERMSDFEETLALGAESDIRRRSGREYQAGAVRLLTVHAAKGLEFPVVFLAGVGQGEFPMERGKELVDETEERRLFFVALTRAKEELFVTAGGYPSAFWRQLSALTERFIIQPPPSQQESEQLSLF